MRSTKALIPLVEEVQNAPRIQRAALHCMVSRRETCVLVSTPEKYQR